MYSGGRSKWKSKKSSRTSLLLVSLLLIFVFFFVFYQEISTFIRPISRTSKSLSFSPHFPQCDATSTPGKRFLFYAPHSGFSNQFSELKNAILMAAILNRTLIVPPVLDHHAVALGSCPKFRVLNPGELRLKVWDHALELAKQGRYISMGEIVDLSSISESVSTIDLRSFVLSWCGVELHHVCSPKSSLLNKLRQCGSLLSGLNGNVDKCLYAIEEDCRTTVWTYELKDSDVTLDSFQPDEQLRQKKKITYLRHHRNVYKSLGPGTEADLSTVLAFGSLFTAPYKGSQLYIDIHESTRDHRIQSLLQKIEYVPFAPAIMSGGKEYVEKVIKEPFLCAQLRLLDGQFKNHWKATFSALGQKLESLKQRGNLPVHIFVMTDLPKSRWKGSYLEKLANDPSSFKLHVLNNDDEFVRKLAMKIGGDDKGNIPDNCTGFCCRQPPDVLLYLEETICSHASLGFVGTAGSTIAESIELMRKNTNVEQN